MDKLLYTKLYNEAVAIGDNLLDSSLIDKNGIYWKTMSLDDNIKVVESVTENMYNGTSGIALFLLDLYRVTGDKKYFECSISAMNWVFKFCENNTAFQYGFYTGRMSVCIAALRFYQFTNDKKYLENALNVIKGIKQFSPQYSVDDLIGGNGGALLGLLHLHAYTNEKWLLVEINKYVGILLSRMHIGKKGIYWDRIPDFVTGLCGFSHGAAGLGFIFLEAGHYLQNKAFYWLATKAFEYESYYYNKELGNWVDLRRHKTTQQLIDQQKAAFLNNDVDYFTKYRYMNAWCHGAAGIGLSRLRAFEILKEKRYLEHSKTAVKTTVSSDLQAAAVNNLMIYCHGNCGNADLFIESYLRLGSKESLSYAEKAAEQAIKHRMNNGFYRSDYRLDETSVYEDRSLFTGIAGIGHYYLRVLDPEKIASVLMPVLNKTIYDKTEITKYEYLSLTEKELKLTAYKRVYPKTISMLEQVNSQSIKRISNLDDNTNLVQSFRKYFGGEIKKITVKHREALKDIFRLENKMIVADHSIQSFALLDIKQIVENEKALSIIKIEDNELLNLKLKINDIAVLYKSKWDWNSKKISNNLKETAGTHYVLLKKQTRGIAVNYISPLVYAILSAFNKEDQVKNIIREVTEIFDVTDKKESEMLQTLVLSQIKELITSHYLITV